VGAFVLGVVERMDLGPFEIAGNQDGELLVFEIRGAAARALASGDARCGDALQLLANQAAGQLESEARRVVVDVEGDAEAREAFLGRLAKRVARRARESRRAVALDPMNGRDRRLIHLALRDEEGIATMSMGEGRYRQVVVAPEGTAEFAEAQAQSPESGERSDS
jgi:spoIIIJ-associated protein